MKITVLDKELNEHDFEGKKLQLSTDGKNTLVKDYNTNQVIGVFDSVVSAIVEKEEEVG